MELQARAEMSTEGRSCPKCGAEEAGYFCGSCGALLYGEDMVLCPRCHHVVAAGEFCSQCGQGLEGIALSLQQLALAGEDFWVTTGAAVPLDAQPGGEDLGLLEPDDSVVLADAELPDWLKELPVDSAPAEVQEHVYPSLVPIEEERGSRLQGSFFALVLVLLGLMLLILIAAIVVLLVRGV